jgi:hypothetical protein
MDLLLSLLSPRQATGCRAATAGRSESNDKSETERETEQSKYFAAPFSVVIQANNFFGGFRIVQTFATGKYSTL